MVQRALIPDTLSEFRALPDDRVNHFIEGRIYSHARPRAAHADISAALVSELRLLFQDTRRGGPGGWVLLFEPELALGGDILVPDIAAWRRERMPRVPDVTQFTLAPDWVCEVHSKSTEALDRGPKLRSYLRAQVPHLWYVQPASKSIEVFRKIGEFYSLVNSGLLTDPIELEPFDAAVLELGEFGEWADDKPEL